MKLDEFFRLYPLRARNLMWLLGAGASVAAGVPSAYDLIWLFKRMIYCSRERIAAERLPDLSNDVFRRHLQAYFDSTGEFPKENDPAEYAVYFERALPDEQDRRRYLEQLLSTASPSYGHLVLAHLISLDRVRLVWTTNFDRLIEDAVAKISGTTSTLTVSTIHNPEVARDALNDSRWPLLIKLHGDFHSSRLKNIPSELLRQDDDLRQELARASQRFGLMVIGYSGRDASIMDTLDQIVATPNALPQGLFWFHRAEQPPATRVSNLIKRAREAGVRAEVLQIETFDEFLGDLATLVEGLYERVKSSLSPSDIRLTDASVPEPGSGWPILRMNALPVISFPEVVRRVDCAIGGTAAVRKAVQDASVDVIAVRSKEGVLAFGSDKDVRTAFDPYGIREFDLISVDHDKLAKEAAQWSLLYDAITHALVRELPLVMKRRRHPKILALDPSRVLADGHSLLRPLISAVGSLSGHIRGTNLQWIEAFRIRIEYRLNRLWLLIEPCLWVEGEGNEEEAKRFVLDRLNKRFNKTWNAILDAWVHVIIPEREREFRALGITDGVDAVFTVSSVTAFSRRGVPK